MYFGREKEKYIENKFLDVNNDVTNFIFNAFGKHSITYNVIDIIKPKRELIVIKS